MVRSILVTYATRFGSTEEVAEAIAETLREDRHTVDVHSMSDVQDIHKYQAVLLGSAVNHAYWLPEAVAFIKANQAALNRVPVALFTVHIQNTGDDASSRQKRMAYLDEVRPFLTPLSEGFFAGKFDRRGAKLLLPSWVSFFIPTFDLRKWDKIRAWAKDLSPKLVYQRELADS